jgi:uncharacterized protein involved in outer membrane biogenesis
VQVNELAIANPPGFEFQQLMGNKMLLVEVKGGTLLSDTIEVPLIELDGLDVYFEKTADGTNLDPVMANLERFQSEEEDQPTEGRKFVVEKMTIRNITAHVKAPVIGTKTVTVPEITFENLTQDNAQGLVLSELVARVVPAVIASVLSFEGVAELVPNLAKGVLNQVGKLQGVADVLGGAAGEAAQRAGKAIEQLGQGAGEAAEGVGETVEDVGKNVGGALEGLFGGKKDESGE